MKKMVTALSLPILLLTLQSNVAHALPLLGALIRSQVINCETEAGYITLNEVSAVQAQPAFIAIFFDKGQTEYDAVIRDMVVVSGQIQRPSDGPILTFSNASRGFELQWQENNPRSFERKATLSVNGAAMKVKTCEINSHVIDKITR